jgi:hypothetical protein
MIIPLPLNKVGIVCRIFGTEAPGSDRPRDRPLQRWKHQ